jgi:hypothetical protein
MKESIKHYKLQKQHAGLILYTESFCMCTCAWERGVAAKILPDFGILTHANWNLSFR